MRRNRWFALALSVALTLTVGVLSMVGGAHRAFASGGDADGDLEGCYWSNKTVTLENYAVYNIDVTAWNNGLNSWDSTAQPYRYSVTSSSPNVLLNDTDNSSVGWDGLTSYSCSGGYFSGTNTSTLNYYYTQSYSQAEANSPAAHELGHDLGLAHENGAVLMNPYTCGAGSRWCTYGINTPQSDDVTDVNGLPNGG